MIRKKNNIVRSEEGAAAIEFALMLPLVLVLFYGMLVFSNYNLVSRRIDSTVNDIAFLISREGQIAYHMDNQNRYFGGRDYLNALADTIIPISMFPFITNDYSYNIKMVGTPFYNSANTGDVCGDNNKIMKVMWSHSGTANGLAPSNSDFPREYSITCETRTFNTGTGTQAYAFSSYHPDNSISNFELGTTSHMPGQAFIVMGMSYAYDQNNGNNGPAYVGNAVLSGLEFLTLGIPGMPTELRRMASYPVRFLAIRDVNGDGFVTQNEMRTELQTCTDCNHLNSILTTGTPERTACNQASTVGYYYGGCNYSIY